MDDLRQKVLFYLTFLRVARRKRDGRDGVSVPERALVIEILNPPPPSTAIREVFIKGYS